MRKSAAVAVLAMLLMGACLAVAQAAGAGPEAHRVVEYTLPPDKLEKAHALYRLQIWYAIAASFYGVAVLFILLGKRVGARLRDFAERQSSRRWVQGIIVTSIFAAIVFVAEFPWYVYGHTVSVRYGFSIQGWGGWLLDRLKDLGGQVFISCLLGLILYETIRRSPRRWWFFMWLATIPLTVGAIVVVPWVIDPMYHHFEPLQKTNPALVASLEKVVKSGGLEIPPERIFEMRASEKVTLLNAYVTGLGPSKRVVVWDTTEKKLTEPEILFIFGHEMGHYVLGHVFRGTLLGIAGTFFLLLALWWIARWAQMRWGDELGIRELHDWASVPLLWLVVSVLLLVTEPVGNAFSRQMEHDADIYGIEVTHGIIADQKQVAAHAFQALGENGLDYPYVSRAVELLWWTHPTIRDRVRFAQEYDPLAEGKPTKFVH